MKPILIAISFYEEDSSRKLFSSLCNFLCRIFVFKFWTSASSSKNFFISAEDNGVDEQLGFYSNTFCCKLKRGCLYVRFEEMFFVKSSGQAISISYSLRSNYQITASVKPFSQRVWRHYVCPVVQFNEPMLVSNEFERRETKKSWWLVTEHRNVWCFKYPFVSIDLIIG